jgi:hypothetical protein
VPHLLAIQGLYDVEYRITVACRNGNIYTIKVHRPVVDGVEAIRGGWSCLHLYSDSEILRVVVVVVVACAEPQIVGRSDRVGDHACIIVNSRQGTRRFHPHSHKLVYLHTYTAYLYSDTRTLSHSRPLSLYLSLSLSLSLSLFSLSDSLGLFRGAEYICRVHGSRSALVPCQGQEELFALPAVWYIVCVADGAGVGQRSKMFSSVAHQWRGAIVQWKTSGVHAARRRSRGGNAVRAPCLLSGGGREGRS